MRKSLIIFCLIPASFMIVKGGGGDNDGCIVQNAGLVIEVQISRIHLHHDDVPLVVLAVPLTGSSHHHGGIDLERLLSLVGVVHVDRNGHCRHACEARM